MQMPSRSIHAIVLRDVAPRHPKLVSGYRAKVLTGPALVSPCVALRVLGTRYLTCSSGDEDAVKIKHSGGTFGGEPLQEYS